MAYGRANRSDTGLVVAFALLNGLLIATNVGLISYVINSVLDGKVKANATPNSATTFLLIFTAAAVLIGLTSIVLGLIHSARENHSIRSSAFSLSLAATILYMLCVGFGSKQTQLGGEGKVEKAIFALDVILAVAGAIYTVLLYIGIPHGEGPAGIGAAGTSPAGAYRNEPAAVNKV